jgi:hypothetical protein
MEKPGAVDPVGIRSLFDSAEKAPNKMVAVDAIRCVCVVYKRSNLSKIKMMI